MSKKFELVFSDDKGERLRLAYQVLDAALPRRWLAVLLMASEDNERLDSKFTGALLLEERTIRAQIENGALKVREKTGRDILGGNLPMFSQAADLNPILQACREIIERESGGSDSSIETNAIVSDVIDDVARYYSLYDPDHHFHIDLSYKIQPKYFLNSSDFESFTPDRRDGWIYLAYCQTGTPPFAAYLQKSSVLPNPQNSFATGFQLLYRDTHTYSDSEKADAALWTANRFGRKVATPREAIGQIPLARPIHGFSREEVLQVLVEFQGGITYEISDEANKLDARSAKKLISADDGRRRKFHPYIISGVEAGLVSKVIAHTMGQAWLLWREAQPVYLLLQRLFYRLMQSFYDTVQVFHNLRPKIWSLQFKITAPFRKAFYIVRYLVRNHRAIIKAKVEWLSHRLRILVQPTYRLLQAIHDLRPKLWSLQFKITAPFRKAFYIVRYLVRNHRAIFDAKVPGLRGLGAKFQRVGRKVDVDRSDEKYGDDI